ncbi:hypothetical protein [Bradyrhizobium diazoefficiens]|uniref:hypothetical protein n=1 Tax=Bradyrhizobium diazoefficiens TaxID=1355477 RepID=UPI0038376B52
MVEMVMGEKDRVDGAKRHAGLAELHHDAAARIEQDVLFAEPDQRGRRHAARVRARAAGAEQYDFHGAYSSVQIPRGLTLDLKSAAGQAASGVGGAAVSPK